MRWRDRILILLALGMFGHSLLQAAIERFWIFADELRRPPPTLPGGDVGAPAPRRPPPGAPLLAPISQRDPSFSVAPTAPRRPDQRSIGSAFAVGPEGAWMTARHVIDGCRRLQLRRAGSWDPASVVFSHPAADIAVLHARGDGPPLPVTEGPFALGEDGFAFGIAGQGGPSAIHGVLLGRARAVQSGRMSGATEVTVWAERAIVPPGERWIGGMSGGPLMTVEGAVAGVMSVASQRRGRIFTVAPETVAETMRRTRLTFVPTTAVPAPVTPAAMERVRGTLLDRRTVVQVLCTG
ncbi:MAG: serine protease [Alphaproteobacteria bacterium]|nr:serine protease [Alphaproteobacteria bacterium]